MNNYKVVINKGFYLGKTKLDIINTTLNLIKSEKICFGIDNALALYIKDNENIKFIPIEFKKEYRKIQGNFSIPKEINTDFKSINFKNSIEINFQEDEVWIDNKHGYITLFLYPFEIFSSVIHTLVYPIIKVYDDNTIIISYNIYSDKKEISEDEFCDAFYDINVIEFDNVLLPKCYCNIEDDNILEYMQLERDGEDIQYLKTSYFRNLKDITNYIISLFESNEDTDIFYSRTSFYLYDDIKYLPIVNTVLTGVNKKHKFAFKYKNFSMNKNIKRYFNEIATVVVSNEGLQLYSGIQAVEERMIKKTIDDTIVYRNLINDKYNYKELKNIYNKMLYNNIDDRESNYGEINIILEQMYNFMNRKKRIESLKLTIEQKIKEKESYYQEKTTLFVMLLSSAPLVDYVILPLIVNILHFDSVYKLINLLKNNFSFIININFLKVICYTISVLGIYFLYKYVIKKKM
ncbi:MAG: hypothetical protein RR136_03185 [Clostridia bacterium]